MGEVRFAGHLEGDYRFLSNAYTAHIEMDGVTWRSAMVSQASDTHPSVFSSAF